MMMPPSLRKLALLAHVTASVGWLGAVVVFLALAIAGLTSQNPQTVRAVYIAAGLITWAVIVPLCIATLITGLIQSLGTTWGLFRHYWVVAKLVLALVGTLLLLLHTQPIDHLASIAATSTLTGVDRHATRVQLVFDASAALLLLLVATLLSVYKPRGLTAYGRRKDATEPAVLVPATAQPPAEPTRASVVMRRPAQRPRWAFITGLVAIHVVVLVIILHLTGRGLGGHG